MNFLAGCQRTHLLIGAGSRGNTSKPGTVPITTAGQTDELAELVEHFSMAWLNFQTSQPWGWLIKQGTLAFANGVGSADPMATLTNYRDWVPFHEPGRYRQRKYVLSYATANGQTGEQKVYFEPYEVFRGFRDRSPVASGRPIYFTIHPDMTWEVYPTPDQDYTLRLDYLTKAQKLVAATDGALKLEDYPAAGRGLPDDLQDVVVWLAIKYWAETRGDLKKLELAERRYREMLKPIKERYLPGLWVACP